MKKKNKKQNKRKVSQNEQGKLARKPGLSGKEEIIIDATNAVVGRLASYVAKQALQGKKIVIVNCNEAIKTGNKKDILESYKVKRARGGSGQKGPYFPKTSERILKRTIRNMLPYQQARGREAFKRIICYNKTPKEYEEKKKIKSGRGAGGIKLSEISKRLKGE